ncbi:MAG: glycosyltransferase [Bacteroidaceae bacterium]|nr:glycosyltransferase [Bacteroidaceae bacterium]
MKHIYIIDEHQSSKQNGVGTYIQQLLKCFEGSGHDVNLISFNSDEKEFMVEQHSSYTEYHVPICGIGGFLSNGPLTLSLLRLYIEDNESNVFLVNHSPCFHFLKTIKKLFPLSPIIFTIHDQGWCAPLLGDVTLFRKVIYSRYTPKHLAQKWSIIRRFYHEECRMYSIVDKVVSLAEDTSDILKTIYHVPSSKIHLIPNGKEVLVHPSSEEDLEKVRRLLGLNNNEKVLLYAGRTVESKGIIPLLMAFEKAYEDHHNIHLIIAGQVFKFNDFAEKTPLSSTHITYTGLIPESQMERWYQIADVCVFPSYTEQCSYFGIEILAHGKMIVATNGHNMRDMFDEDASLIVPIIENQERFSERLYKELKYVLQLPDELFKKYKKKARFKYEKQYTLNRMRSLYVQLLANEI